MFGCFEPGQVGSLYNSSIWEEVSPTLMEELGAVHNWSEFVAKKTCGQTLTLGVTMAGFNTEQKLRRQGCLFPLR